MHQNMQPNIGNKGMQQIALVVCRKMYFACMYFEFFTGSKEMCDGCHHRKDFHTRAAVAILRISLFFFENTQNQGFSQFTNGQWSSTPWFRNNRTLQKAVQSADWSLE